MGLLSKTAITISTSLRFCLLFTCPSRMPYEQHFVNILARKTCYKIQKTTQKLDVSLKIYRIFIENRAENANYEM